MKLPHLFHTLLAVAALGATCVAELPPQLKPLAEAFDRERITQEVAKEAALKPARDRYLFTLTNAQKSATAAARTADIAAITAEIGAVNANAVPSEFPPGLPRSVAVDRRGFSAALEGVTRTFPGRQRDLATRYLQSLAALEAQALQKKDTKLTEAVAGEKQRALACMESAGGGQKNRNVVENGEFTNGQPGAWPPGWRKSSNWKQANDLALVQEGSEKFIRFRRLQAIRQTNLIPEKDIPIPERARAVECSVRLRVEGLVPGTVFEEYPGLIVSLLNAAGEKLTTAWAHTQQPTGWRRFTARCEIPAATKVVRIELGPFGAAGIIDLDDVVVEFK